MERYETALRTNVDEIRWAPLKHMAGAKRVLAIKDGDSKVDLTVNENGVVEKADHEEARGKTLEDLVGKEIAKRILSEDSGSIEEDGLVIGGKGMTDFYDKILVNAANKLGKRFGVKVGRGEIEGAGTTAIDRQYELWRPGAAESYSGPWQTREEAAAQARPGDVIRQVGAATVHTLPITPDMRATVKAQGFSTFAPRFAVAPPKDSEAFKRWFKQSKVVDESGKPLVVFHGSPTPEFTAFDPKKAYEGEGAEHTGPGFYFTTSPESANRYSALRGKEQGGVFPVYLSIQKPLRVDFSKGFLTGTEHILTRRETEALIREAPEFNDPDGPISNWGDVRYEGWEKIIGGAVDGYEGGALGSAMRNDWFPDSESFLRAVNKVLGYDGTVSDTVAGDTHWVAWFPTQIKSATGQAGTYSPESADIRFAVKAEQDLYESVKLPTHNTWRRWVTRVADLYDPVNQLVARAKEKGLVSDATNPEIALVLQSGKIKDQIEGVDGFVRQTWDPVHDHSRKHKLKLDDAGLYVYARHAPERNKQITKISAQGEPGSGMWSHDARKIVEFYESGEQGAEFKKLGELFDAANKATRQYWIDNGLMPEEAVEAMEAVYDHYAPLKNDLSKEDLKGTPRIGTGQQVRGNETMRALGRSSLASGNPIVWAVTQSVTSVIRAHKAEAGRRLLALVRSNPEAFKGLVEIDKKLPPRKVLVNGEVRLTGDPTQVDAPNVFTVRENGKDVRLVFTEEAQDIPIALRRINARYGPEFVQQMGRATRWLAAMNTRWNPAFLPINVLRDVGQGFIIFGGEKGFVRGLRMAASIPLVWPTLAKGAVKGKLTGGSWKGKDPADMSTEEFYDEYVATGGPIAVFGLRDFDDVKVDMIARLKDSPDWKKRIGAIAEVMGKANDVFENGARFSAYISLRKSGESAEQAAVYAKRMTVNFEQGGEYKAVLNALYMFANAGVVGTHRIFQALKNPGVQAIVSGAVMGSFLLALANRASGDDPDDGENYWDKLPDFVKRNNLVIMHHDGSGRYHTIPLPYGFNWFFNLGTQTEEFFFGDAPKRKIAQEVMLAAADAFNPLGGGVDPLEIVSPTVVDPFLELARNKDWAGRQISPDWFWKDTPDSEKFWPTTNPRLVEAMRAINKATGGDRVVPGMIDWSPETVNHLWKFALGGVGRMSKRLLNVGDKLVHGEEIESRDIPVVRRLYGTPSKRFYIHRFYDNADKLDQIERQIEAAIEDGEPERAKRLKADNAKLLRVKPMFEAAEKRVKSYKKKAAAAKSEATQIRLEETIEKLMKDANRKVATARK